MPTTIAELASGSSAGSRILISWIPTLGKINTWLDARVGGPFEFESAVLPSPHADRMMSVTLRNREITRKRFKNDQLHTNRLSLSDGNYSEVAVGYKYVTGIVVYPPQQFKQHDISYPQIHLISHISLL